LKNGFVEYSIPNEGREVVVGQLGSMALVVQASSDDRGLHSVNYARRFAQGGIHHENSNLALEDVTKIRKGLPRRKSGVFGKILQFRVR